MRYRRNGALFEQLVELVIIEIFNKLDTFQESHSEERRYSSRFSEFTGSKVWGLLSGQGAEIAIFKCVKVNCKEEGIICSLLQVGILKQMP